MPECLYLHGFASSPASAKAAFFRERLERAGFDVHVPDLNEGSFEHLTISRILALVRRMVAGLPSAEPLLLMGSSLGGYAAAVHLATGGRADAAVLLAPAFNPEVRWRHLMGEDELREWQRTGVRLFEHHAMGSPQPLRYAFFEDARLQDPMPDCGTVPTLILQGRRDETVPVETALEYHRRYPQVRLEVVETDHQMIDRLDELGARVDAFLGSLSASRWRLRA